MENRQVAQVLQEIADLLELKESNPFRIRAYRNASATIADHAEQLRDLADDEIRALPGIGKDLAGKIREIIDTGSSTYHQTLLDEFPAGVLDLLRLQGVGPKTAALLYTRMGIASLEDLEAAARAGRLREIRGMGARKEELILKALQERRQHAGRFLMPRVREQADAIVAHLRAHAPDAIIDLVGSLRRGTETCGDLDILATGTHHDLMAAFTHHPSVERVLGHGSTKSSVTLHGGLQCDLRVVPAESRGAALQYFTGSRSHNIALRDRAMQQGLKLNEYGLFDASSGAPVAGHREEEIYERLGLGYIPPELRELRGEMVAAETGTLPRLIERRDLIGDIHMHTTATDGHDDIRAMATAARAAGLRYVAITDHSQALAMAGGLNERQVLQHARQIRRLDRELDDITVLAGVECDIRANGTLDLAEDCLAELDVVIASVHSHFAQDRQEMTERVLMALESPVVDVLGHPTGRLLLKREPYELDVERVIAAAARLGVALEINSQINRLDLNDTYARLARDRGVPLVISSDAHSCQGLDLLQWGVIVARRAWLESGDVLNTLPVKTFRNRLRRAKATSG